VKCSPVKKQRIKNANNLNLIYLIIKATNSIYQNLSHSNSVSTLIRIKTKKCNNVRAKNFKTKVDREKSYKFTILCNLVNSDRFLLEVILIQLPACFPYCASSLNAKQCSLPVA